MYVKYTYANIIMNNIDYTKIMNNNICLLTLFIFVIVFITYGVHMLFINYVVHYVFIIISLHTYL